MAWAKRSRARRPRVRDDRRRRAAGRAELRGAAVHRAASGIRNLTVIVDHNKVQSDKPVGEIVDARRPRGASSDVRLARCSACDGHDYAALERDRRRGCVSRIADRPNGLSPTRSRAAASRSWSTRARWRTAAATTAGTPARPGRRRSRRRTPSSRGRRTRCSDDVGLEPLASRAPCAGMRPASCSSRATRLASR